MRLIDDSQNNIESGHVNRTDRPCQLYVRRQTGSSNRYAYIITRSSGAVKAYSKKIKALKPVVQGVFRFHVAMTAACDFPLSVRYNALHGPISLCGLLASMAFTKSCGNDAAKLLALRVDDVAGGIDPELHHLPTSQWTLKMLASLDHSEMEAACKAAFRACTAAAGALGMIPRRPVGMIDEHKAAYYGEKGDKEHIVKSKSKDGTTRFHSFISSLIRAGPYSLHTAMRRVCKGVPTAEYVRDLLAQNREVGIMCAHWIVDRLFFNVASMCEFGKADEYFLMYARMTVGIKKALAEYMDGTRPAMSEYIVKSKRAKFTGTLAFVERTKTDKKGRRKTVILPVFSNLPWNRLRDAIANLPIEMKKRWAQESAFRVAKFSKPMTTSNNPSLRTFFFATSLLYGNMWAMADHVAEAQRRTEAGEPPRQMPPADDRLGDGRCLAAKTKYNLTSKEFLSLFVSEAARLLTMDKQVQDDYTKMAVAENVHLLSQVVTTRPILTGEYASGIPRWG